MDRVDAHRGISHRWEFRTHRKGNLAGDVGWVPVNEFFYDYSSVLVRYAIEHGLESLPIIGLLSGGRDGDVGPVRR